VYISHYFHVFSKTVQLTATQPSHIFVFFQLMQTVSQNKILITRRLTMHLIYVGCTGTTISTFQIQKVNCVVFYTSSHTTLLKNINDKPQYKISSDITTVNINTLQPRTPPFLPH
jgi:hypothetical protein